MSGCPAAGSADAEESSRAHRRHGGPGLVAVMMAVGAALVLLVAFILVATVELDPPGLAVIVLVGLLGLALFLSVGGVAAAAFALKRGGTPVNLLAVVVGAVGIAVSVYALGILATAFV